jgi:hypothetical protein
MELPHYLAWPDLAQMGVSREQVLGTLTAGATEPWVFAAEHVTPALGQWLRRRGLAPPHLFAREFQNGLIFE